MPLKLVVVPMLITVMLIAAAPVHAKIRGDAKVDMKMGMEAARRGYWQEALTRFEAANEKVPGKVKILNNLAVALEAVGRYDEALAVYENAISLAPGDRNLSRNVSLFREFYNSYVRRPIEDTDTPEGEAPQEPGADAEEETEQPVEGDTPPPDKEAPAGSGGGV